MDPQLEGKVALVTGGSSGLGRATCRALAAAGANVVVADVAGEAGRAGADELGGHFVRTDVANIDDDKAMVRETVERFGGLDFVHLNAGVSSGFGIDETFDIDRYRLA